MPNALADETSPYLLQHKDNPVDWRPWDEAALALAKEQDKPIFLSIGYSACHWCHVMEHESFENEAIAAALNEHFVSIKVDREERPDLDQIYMQAVQEMTGRGGWPMSVFLTPDLKPFYGGTYWPPHAGRGMPGFDQVLEAVRDAWTNRRDEALSTAEQLTARLGGTLPAGDSELSHELIEAAGRQLERTFDATHGGFGEAPKFPHTMDLAVLMRLWKSSERDAWLDMIRLTLDRMAHGGIYDHLGGGFARYSVDERWLVPHFEKMLYDNALLAGVYVDAFAATGEPMFARIARETLDYVLQDMTDPAGGFYSTEDADSAPHNDPSGHKEEGLFYTWKPEEIRKTIGEDTADLFCRVYDVTPIGNFEGRNILWLPKPIATSAKMLGINGEDLEKELAAAREKLLATRNKRPRPGLDDKVLASWNGLMIEALARAGAVLAEPSYIAAATKAADFVLDAMRDEQGRLLHSWRNGQAKHRAYLDDYAAMACGLLAIYGATFDERRIDQATELMQTVLDHFADADGGAFFYTADDHEQLIVRQKDLMDNATPGGNSLTATALVKLGKLTGDAKWLQAAHGVFVAALPVIERAPAASGQMLCALDLYLGPTRELVLTGAQTSTQQIADRLRQSYSPRTLLAGRLGGEYRSPLLDSLFAGKDTTSSEPTLYVCEDHACESPLVGAAAINAGLQDV